MIGPSRYESISLSATVFDQRNPEPGAIPAQDIVDALRVVEAVESAIGHQPND